MTNQNISSLPGPIKHIVPIYSKDDRKKFLRKVEARSKRYKAQKKGEG
jgi:hypothetical protein